MTREERNKKIEEHYNNHVSPRKIAVIFGLSYRHICKILRSRKVAPIRKFPDRFQIKFGNETRTLCGRY